MGQGKTYISKALDPRVEAIEDAISVRNQDEQFTGALRYSYLAEQVTPDKAGEDKDLQLLEPAEFEEQRATEDREIRP